MEQVNEASGRRRRRARSGRRARVLGVVLAMIVPLVGGAEARAVVDPALDAVGEWPVSFEIINKNDSKAEQWCQGDEDDGLKDDERKYHTLRGSLVGPGRVRLGQIDAITLYLAGSGDASTWHVNYTGVSGVDHVSEMARKGHASVSLHLLGFGPSDPVDGFDVCFGTYADHIAQVIGQLRGGSYSIVGPPNFTPKFPRIALAGHSFGGFIAELTQVSFAAADALIVAGWTGYAAGMDYEELPFPYDTGERKLQRCATEPKNKPEPDGPGGWAYQLDPDEMYRFVRRIDPTVWAEFGKRYERDPCGWSLAAEATNIALASEVEVPVLVGSGEYDPLASPDLVDQQRERYARNNGDVTSFVIRGAAHQIMLEASDKFPYEWGREFRELLSDWLNRRRF